MKKTQSITLLVCSMFLVCSLAAWGKTEQEKIHLILDRIGNANISFIRNGKKYTGKEAKAHLEMKMKKSWVSIDTVDDFINYIASKSYLSGEHYYVQFLDGKKIKAAEWLRKLEKEIEKAP